MPPIKLSRAPENGETVEAVLTGKYRGAGPDGTHRLVTRQGNVVFVDEVTTLVDLPAVGDTVDRQTLALLPVGSTVSNEYGGRPAALYVKTANPPTWLAVTGNFAGYRYRSLQSPAVVEFVPAVSE